MFGPVATAILLLAIFLGGAACIAWRMVRWDCHKAHLSFYFYLGISMIVGIGFASLPSMILGLGPVHGMDFWVAEAQPNTFCCLIAWFMTSVSFMFLAPRQHLAIPFFSVMAVIADFILFLFMAEAGDLETLGLTFLIMRCTGIALAILSSVSLCFIAHERGKDCR